MTASTYRIGRAVGAPDAPALDIGQQLGLLEKVRVRLNNYELAWGGEVMLRENDKLYFEIDTSAAIPDDPATPPLDIYAINIELERDASAQGIPVNWNVVGPTRKQSKPEWQMRMQEEQYAGDTSVTLVYRGVSVPGCEANIHFQVSRLSQAHYEYMYDVLQAQNEQLLYNPQGRAHVLLANAATPASTRYQLWRQHFDRLHSVLPDILDEPHQELRRFIEPAPTNSRNSVTYASLALAARTGANWQRVAGNVAPAAAPRLPGALPPPVRSPAPKSAAAKGQKNLTSFAQLQALAEAQDEARRAARTSRQTDTRLVPTRLPRVRLDASFDTYENRFLKALCRKMIALAEGVARQLDAEIAVAKRDLLTGSRRTAAALQQRIATQDAQRKDLDVCRQWIAESIRRSFLDGVGDLATRRPSVVLRENRHYRRIRLIDTELEKDFVASGSLVAGLDRHGQAVRLSSVNRLYEYWVVVVTLQAMAERLGFVVVAKEGRPIGGEGLIGKSARRQFNYVLQSGAAMELRSPNGKRVMVYYDRVYPGAEETHAGEFGAPKAPIDYGYYNAKGRFASAKQRPDIAIEVFEPDERVPHIVILDATYSRDQRTLYAKYQYRDTIRDFTRRDEMAYTLSAQVRRTTHATAEPFIPARPVVAAWVVYPDTIELLEHDEYRYGQLPLQPGPEAIDQMAAVLTPLLHRAGAIDLKL